MSESKPLRCRRCGRPIGYVTISAKSYLAANPDVDNVKLTATCIECSSQSSLYIRNF